MSDSQEDDGRTKYRTRSPSEDYDSDMRNRIDRSRFDAMAKQIKDQQERYDQLSKDFDAMRASKTSTTPMPRSKSLYELGDELRTQVRAKLQFGSRLSMLPPQQQQVVNLATNLEEKQHNLSMLTSLISVTENTNVDGKNNALLTKLRRQYLEKIEGIEVLRNEVQSAKDLSSKFEISLPMPDFTNPGGYRFNPQCMDQKEIFRVAGKFNPETTTEFKFSDFWRKIVKYGLDKNMSEQDYIRVLELSLYGTAMSALEARQMKGESLEEIVNGLAAQYEDINTIDDYKMQVDNFTRKKDETITRAMSRATNLIQYLSPLHSKAAWPEKSEDMGIAILKQIVNSSTRIHIDWEEQNMIRAGGSLSLRQMIKSAFDHEKYHKSIPTKDLQTTFQVASMTPRTSIHKDEEKMFLRKEHSVSKNLDDKLAKILQLQQENAIQIAAANFKQRGRTSDNFNKFKSHSRSASASSQKSNGGAISDNDEPMQLDNNQARADKKPYEQRHHQQQQQQAQQFQQKDKKPWNNTPKPYGQKPPQGPQPQQPPQYPRTQQPRTQPGAQSDGTRKYPKTMFRPVLMRHGDYHYYQCNCTNWHIEGTPCPFSIQVNSAVTVEVDEDDDYEVPEANIVDSGN